MSKPGIVSRDGTIIYMPQFPPDAVEKMANAIAAEMVRLGKPIIQEGCRK